MGNQQAAPAPPPHPAPPPDPQESPGSGQVMEVERGAEGGRLSDSPPAVFSVPPARLWEAGSGPAVPLGERWSGGGRARAATLDTTVGQSSPASVQAVFRLSSQPKAETVYLAGTMTGWKTVRMFQPAGETAWVHITDTREGTHHYKFLVDGCWLTEDTEPSVCSESGNRWNVMEVQKSDQEVFAALACDSFTLKNPAVTAGGGSWSQVAPSYDKLELKQKSPPCLPPHLLQVILNRDASQQPDPVLLAEPSHVMLHHLYAQVRGSSAARVGLTRLRRQ